MAFAASSSAPFFAPPISNPKPSSPSKSRHQPGLIILPFPATVSPNRLPAPLRASRRFSDFAPQEAAAAVVPDSRGRREIGALDEGADYETDGGDEDDDEEDEDDRSLDLLVRFLHNIFRKISRRARRAVRSMLPHSVPSKLVGFSVNGVMVLAFLWIIKALLEVVCTLGTTVFVSILVVRITWSGVSYIQENRYNNMDRFGNDRDAWSRVQAAT